MKKTIIMAAMLLAGAWSASAQEISAIPVPDVTNYQTVYSAALGNAEGYAFDSWGGGTGQYIDIQGKQAYQISNFAYFGSGFAAIDATAMDYLHFDIYPMQDMTLAIVPITGAAEKGLQQSLTGGQWNSFDLSVSTFVDKGANMANVFQIKYVSKVVAEGAAGQPDGFANGNGSETFIVGNVYFYKETAQYDDNEAPVIVTAQVDAVTATSATLTLKATDNLSENIYFTVTDPATGNSWRKTAANGAEVSLELTGLATGTAYTVNVVAVDEKDNASDATRLPFTTGEIPAIPEPVKGEYLSLFSPYIGNAGGYFFDSWGGGSGNIINIQGKEGYMISNFHYFGSQFTDVDATEFSTLHYDIYPMQDMTLAIVPITRNAPEKGSQHSLTGGQWNAFEISVQDLIDKGLNMAQLWQMKYVSKVVAEGAAGQVDGFANGDGTESFIVGNAYFVNPLPTGVTEISTAKKGFDPAQPMFNVMGQRVNADYRGIVIQNGQKFVK